MHAPPQHSLASSQRDPSTRHHALPGGAHCATCVSGSTLHAPSQQLPSLEHAPPCAAHVGPASGCTVPGGAQSPDAPSHTPLQHCGSVMHTPPTSRHAGGAASSGTAHSKRP